MSPAEDLAKGLSQFFEKVRVNREITEERLVVSISLWC
jgi:hypothetical protein